jgi:hypothetical protein
MKEYILPIIVFVLLTFIMLVQQKEINRLRNRNNDLILDKIELRDKWMNYIKISSGFEKNLVITGSKVPQDTCEYIDVFITYPSGAVFLGSKCKHLIDSNDVIIKYRY